MNNNDLDIMPHCCCEPETAEAAELPLQEDELCCCRIRQRSADEYAKLVNRLNRIEGQVRGLKGMLDKDAYCTDILVQVTAVNAALNAFSRELLNQHIRTCVVNDIRSGKEETVEELLHVLQKMMK